MNNSTQIKLLLATGGLLLTSAVFALAQSHSLKQEISSSTQQCELKAAALSNQEHPTGTKIKVTTKLTKTIALQQKSNNLAQQATISGKNVENPALIDQPILQTFTESLGDIVERKYRFLLAKLDLNIEDQQELMQRLEEREQLALQLNDAKEFGEELDLSSSDIADLQYRIKELDSEIAQLLGEQEDYYTLLKNSDNEQEEFGQYTLGVSGLAPLDTLQQEHVLFSKLRHKQDFERALQELGVNMDFPLNEEQRSALLSKVNEHAHLYMDGFLREVKPHVDHSNFPMDQYTLLENYTRTEFEQMTQKLKEQINARGNY